MLVYYYGNGGCAELHFLFSPCCSRSHLLGRFPELCAAPVKSLLKKRCEGEMQEN